MREKLAALPVEVEVDEAGNQWATLAGDSDCAVLIGGHIDSVPNGGWLDGCLNVLGGLEVLRRLAEDGPPPVTVRLVDWADEEGARFGRSLLGSSAAAGSMRDQDELRPLRDRRRCRAPGRARGPRTSSSTACATPAAGSTRPPPTSSCTSSRARCSRCMGLPLGAVLGTFGVERHRVAFRGQAAHAGSTPMSERRDALAGVARLELEIREIAGRAGGGRRLHDGQRRDEAGHRHVRRRGGRLPARPAQPRCRPPRRDARRGQGGERAVRGGGADRGRLGAHLGHRADPLRRDAGRSSATRRSARSRARRTGCRAARCTTRPRSRGPASRP